MRSIEEYHCSLFRGCDTHIKFQDLRVSVMCAGAYQNCVQMNELRAKCRALQLHDQQTRGRISNPPDTGNFEHASMRMISTCKKSLEVVSAAGARNFNHASILTFPRKHHALRETFKFILLNQMPPLSWNQD